MVSHCIAAEASLRRFKGRINGDVSFLSSRRDDERVNARPYLALDRVEWEIRVHYVLCGGMFSKYCDTREK